MPAPYPRELREHLCELPGPEGTASRSRRSRRTWTVTLVPAILQDAGMDVTAGGMIAFSAFPAAFAALLAPALASRMRPTWLPPVVAVLLLGAAFLGLIIAPASGTVARMTVLGPGLAPRSASR